MSHRSMSDLIGAIYDCAVDPALWPATLEQICVFTDSAAGTLAVVDLVTDTERTLVNFGISSEYAQLYRERYHCTDLFLHPLMMCEVGQPALSSDLVPDDELLNSRIYREWAAPQGFRDTLMTMLAKQQARLAFLGVTRRLEQRRYDESDRELMALIAPHVKRAITIADLIDHKVLERERFAEVINALATATLLIDQEGKLLHANRAGGLLLQKGDLLLLREGIIEPADPRQARAFRRSRDGGTDTSPSRSFLLPRGEGADPVIATVLRLASKPHRTSTQKPGHFAVFVQVPETAAPLAAEVIAELFKLTGSELRIISGLIEGASPTELAERYGISPVTVKTHLKNLFQKTGTNRQAELVRLALSSVPPLRAELVTDRGAVPQSSS
jgi:DNA-binding CsgD family transcriptional regulator